MAPGRGSAPARRLLVACGALCLRPASALSGGDPLALLQTSAVANASDPAKALAEAQAPPSVPAAALKVALSQLANISGSDTVELREEENAADLPPVGLTLTMKAAPGSTTVRAEFDQISKPLTCTKSVCFKEFSAQWGDPLTTDMLLKHSVTLHQDDVVNLAVKATVRGPSGKTSFKHSFSCPACGATCSVDVENMPPALREAWGSWPTKTESPPCPLRNGDHIFSMGDILLPDRPNLPLGYTGTIGLWHSLMRGPTTLGGHELELKFGRKVEETPTQAPAARAAAAATETNTRRHRAPLVPLPMAPLPAAHDEELS